MRILVSGGTKTLRRLSPLYPHHLGVLLTPANGNSMKSIVGSGLPWAIDNGAFSGFDPVRFRRLVLAARGKPRPFLWVCCPDVVADARATLGLWTKWREELAGVPAAFVLQDGQEDLELPDAEAYFVGGSTAWKLSQAAKDLCAEAKIRGALLHMGRVNSLKRLTVAFDWGCDSVDGKSWNAFGDTHLEWGLHYIRSLERQPRLFLS